MALEHQIHTIAFCLRALKTDLDKKKFTTLPSKAIINVNGLSPDVEMNINFAAFKRNFVGLKLVTETNQKMLAKL